MDPTTLMSFSFKAYPTWDNRLFFMPGKKKAIRRRIRILEHYVPEGYSFCDGTLLKRWTLSGHMPHLLETIRERPIVIIGASTIEPLITKYQLTNAQLYEIPPFHSQAQRYELVEDVGNLLAAFTPADAPIVLTRAGGSLSFWILRQLQRQHPHATFLDIGQALNPYLVGEPESTWTEEYQQVLFGTTGVRNRFRRDTTLQP